MHRHGYQGRKFGRKSDQRNALIKSLADSLILYESIETTLAKAKETSPYVEKLITKSKKGDLASRRYVIKHLQTIEAANKLVDGIAPKLKNRTSGHLRIVRTSIRRGDNVQLASISFVDDISGSEKLAEKPKSTPKKTAVKKPSTAKKPTAKKATPVKKEAK